MLTVLSILLPLSLGQGEALKRYEFTGVTVKVPKSWQVSSEDDTGKEWASEDERAQLAFSSFPVEPLRPAKACVKQLVEAVKGPAPSDAGPTPTFVNTTIGGQPAAKLITTDYVAETDDKLEENKVTTTTIVGCSGKTKWLLTFSARTSDAARSGALLKRVTDSLTYLK